MRHSRLCAGVAVFFYFLSSCVAIRPPLRFESVDGVLKAHGAPFHICGVNWHGFEADSHLIHGFWGNSKGFEDHVQTLKQNRINAIRLTLSTSMFAYDPPVDCYVDTKLNPGYYKGMSSLTALDMVIKTFAENDILVLIDYHIANPKTGLTKLWHNAEFNETETFRIWIGVVKHYCNDPEFWNVFAFDLKNEPYGSTWGTGDNNTDWKLGAERFGNLVLDVCPRLLLFVQGIGKAADMWWGSDFTDMFAQASYINVTNNNRVVYAPHIYGPSVYIHSYFGAANFPLNMPAVWQSQIGWISERTGRAMVLGEWGSFFSQSNANKHPREEVWVSAWVDWLANFTQNGMGFYWAFPPYSADTGGILKDDLSNTWQVKLDVFKRFQCTQVDQLAGPQITATPAPLKGLGLCYDAGATVGFYDQITDTNWNADRFFVGGQISTATAGSIPTTVSTGMQSMLLTSRFASVLNYTIPINTPGRYMVTLYFVETYWTQVMKRVFSISIQNQTFASSFDIFAEASGKNVPITQSFSVIASNSIFIQFVASANNAAIAGICINPANRATPPPLLPVKPLATASPSHIRFTPSPTTRRVSSIPTLSISRSATVKPLATVSPNSPSPIRRSPSPTTRRLSSTPTLSRSSLRRSVTVSLRAPSTLRPTGITSSLTSSPRPSNRIPSFTMRRSIPTPTTESWSLYIDCGSSSSFSSGSGKVWVADQFFNGGFISVISNMQPINGPVGSDMKVFTSLRWNSDLIYTIPVPSSGSYVVNLFFVENFWNSTGQRVFEISIQGSIVEAGFDIYNAAGAMQTLVVKSFTANVLSSNLSVVVRLRSITNNASVAGLAVAKL
mmetsp:Transcript_6918/g.11360  ORF Transcript_6918/g.11360 Transcript_6918/m.11360 type:complete len:841 (+) Transcript_6918:160-2682(+)